MSEQFLEAVDHVQVPVGDLDEAVTWYVRHLGFKIHRRPDDELAILSLSSGPTLFLWKTEDKTTANFMKNGETMPAIGIRARNIDRLHQKLQEEDVEVASFTNDGFRTFLKFFDLNGNMFVVYEEHTQEH